MIRRDLLRLRFHYKCGKEGATKTKQDVAQCFVQISGDEWRTTQWNEWKKKEERLSSLKI